MARTCGPVSPGPCAPVRAPDVIVALTGGRTPWPGTRPPCRTVVGLFPRRYENHSFDESRSEYVPDSPPEWARVVDTG